VSRRLRRPRFLKVHGETQSLGDWRDGAEAALARDRAILYFGLDRPLRFPREARKLGPASPEQLRRLSRQIFKATTSSRYHNVSWDPRKSTWLAIVRVEGRVIRLGSYDDEDEAARAYDMAAAHFELPGPRNFPDAGLPARSPRQLKAVRRAERSRSPYAGVMWIPTSDERPWYVGVTVGYGKTRLVGGYRTDKEACVARDRVYLFYRTGKPLEFPREARALGAADFDTLRREVRAVRKESCTSRYRGVSWDRKRQLWQVQITVDKVVHTLGRFDDEIDAACAYDAAALRLLDAREAQFRMNFPDANPRPAIRKQVREEDWSLPRKRRNASSVYFGVTRVRSATSASGAAWVVYITARDGEGNRRRHYLGTYDDEKAAALAYDRAALHLLGTKPRTPLNFPRESRKLGPASPRILRERLRAQRSRPSG
jgi:hypothetical protein